MEMTKFAQTVALLGWADFPIRSIDLSTVQYWLMRGYEPSRIATEIFSVDPAIVEAAENGWPVKES